MSRKRAHRRRPSPAAQGSPSAARGSASAARGEAAAREPQSSAARARPQWERRAHLLAWLAVPLAFVAHRPALGAGFVLDDRALVAENPFLRSAAGLPALLGRSLFEASGDLRVTPYYRPVAALANWASVQLLGTAPGPQHALNVALHGVVVALLARALLGAGVRAAAALTAAGVLLVHPATPDVVAYVGGRHELLGWCALLAGLAAVRAARGAATVAAAAALCTALAALAREAFIVAPLLLVLWARVTDRGVADAPRARPWLALAGGGAATVAVTALRLALAIPAPDLHGAGPGGVLSAAPGVLLRVVQVAVWPTDVSVDVTPSGPTALTLVAAAMTVAALAGAALVTLRLAPALEPVASVGALVVLLAGVTAAPSVPAFGFMSDRYAYAAVVGVSALAAVGLELALQALARRPAAQQGPLVGVARGALLVGASAALLVSSVPATWARAADWRDEATLQRAMVRARPEDPQSRLALGMFLLDRGALPEAEGECAAYAAALPWSDRANRCLGQAALARGEVGRAIALLEPYVLARPSLVPSRVMLLQAHFSLQHLDRIEELLALLEPAAPGAPDLAEARAELARRRARGPAAPAPQGAD